MKCYSFCISPYFVNSCDHSRYNNQEHLKNDTFSLTSGQIELTGTRFSYTPKTTKKLENYMKQWLSRYQTWDSEEEWLLRQGKWTNWTCGYHSLLLEERFQAAGQSPRVEKKEHEIQGGPTSLDFTGQSNRWKRLDTERVPEIWRGIP